MACNTLARVEAEAIATGSTPAGAAVAAYEAAVGVGEAICALRNCAAQGETCGYDVTRASVLTEPVMSDQGLVTYTATANTRGSCKCME